MYLFIIKIFQEGMTSVRRIHYRGDVNLMPSSTVTERQALDNAFATSDIPRCYDMEDGQRWRDDRNAVPLLVNLIVHNYDASTMPLSAEAPSPTGTEGRNR